MLGRWEVSQDNLVLSIGLIMGIGHRKEIRKLTFQALALRRSESIPSDEGRTLKTSTDYSLILMFSDLSQHQPYQGLHGDRANSDFVKP